MRKEARERERETEKPKKPCVKERKGCRGRKKDWAIEVRERARKIDSERRRKRN